MFTRKPRLQLEKFAIKRCKKDFYNTIGTFLPSQSRRAMSVIGVDRPTYAQCEFFAF